MLKVASFASELLNIWIDSRKNSSSTHAIHYTNVCFTFGLKPPLPLAGSEWFLDHYFQRFFCDAARHQILCISKHPACRHLPPLQRRRHLPACDLRLRSKVEPVVRMRNSMGVELPESENAENCSTLAVMHRRRRSVGGSQDQESQVPPAPNMDGKVVIVTGGNTGIGYATAKTLAVLGAHVIIACRSEERAVRVSSESHRSTIPLVTCLIIRSTGYTSYEGGGGCKPAEAAWDSCGVHATRPLFTGLSSEIRRDTDREKPITSRPHQ